MIDIEAGGKHTKFAKMAGIPISTFQSYLSQRIPKPEHLIRISEKFNVSMDWLLTGKGDQYISEEENQKEVGVDDSAPLGDDPVISNLLQDARKILKSGNKEARETLERNIRYFSLAVETERRFRGLENRISQIEESVISYKDGKTKNSE